MIHIQTTAVLVSLLPPDHELYIHYTISVEWRGKDRWAVVYNGYVVDADGEWDYEPRVSERTESWLKRYRFDYDTAIQLASKHAAGITVNGHTVNEILEQS